MNNLNEKLKELKKIIERYDNLGIAFSGGVDSTFLLAFASKLQSINFKVTALTVNSSNFAPDEIEFAKEFCIENGINHIIICLLYTSDAADE